jgi:hypothetical protein
MSIRKKIAHVLNVGLRTAVSGIQEGSVVIYQNSDPYYAALPTGTAPWLQKAIGLASTAGFVGQTLASGAEVALHLLGIVPIRLAASTAMLPGDQLIADAGELGAAKVRAPYSYSALVLGHGTEAFTADAGSGQRLGSAEVKGYWIETVRSRSGGSAETLGAATTSYYGGSGASKSGTPIVVYQARTTGEAVRLLGINLITAPGGTDTVAATIVKSSDNGTTWTDTAVTCTATGTAKAANDLTHSAQLTSGDILGVKAVSSAGTAAGFSYTFDVT